MPEELTPSPDATEEETPVTASAGPMAQIVSQMTRKPAKAAPAKPREAPDGDKPAGRELYDELMDDRPRKMTPEQAHYESAPEGQVQRCANCFHFYTRPLDNHHVCELVRPANDENIKPEWYCHFWNDGKSDELPLLKESAPAKKD